MSDDTLPAHLETLLSGLRDDPALAEGATTAVGQLTGTQRAEAAATYYRSKGYDVTADELTALEIARKQATGEPLSEHELETVAGGWKPNHDSWDSESFSDAAKFIRKFF